MAGISGTSAILGTLAVRNILSAYTDLTEDEIEAACGLVRTGPAVVLNAENSFGASIQLATMVTADGPEHAVRSEELDIDTENPVESFRQFLRDFDGCTVEAYMLVAGTEVIPECLSRRQGIPGLDEVPEGWAAFGFGPAMDGIQLDIDIDWDEVEGEGAGVDDEPGNASSSDTRPDVSGDDDPISTERHDDVSKEANGSVDAPEPEPDADGIGSRTDGQ